MTTTTHPQGLGEGLDSSRSLKLTGSYEQSIQGRFRRITTHQLAFTWWLHQAGHITRRQLRITFAAHEMAERRRYASSAQADWKPLYELREIAALVGGSGSKTAERDLSADVKRLGELGLVKISQHSIEFARSVEQLKLEGSLESFWTMFDAFPHRKRAVPVPRRTLRALAAGFSRGVTAYMLAALIRSVFWHRETGQYRTDGRAKLGWISETFGISRRAATDARAHLIELGWLEPLEVEQWELNKWGVRDAVNVHWAPANGNPGATSIVDNSASTSMGEKRVPGESASPLRSKSGESASPSKQVSSSSRNLETRKLGGRAPGPSGDSISSKEQFRDRTRPRRAPQRPGSPSIRDVQPEDLRDPKALLELHGQAVAAGLACSSSAGELDFFALANRARARGQRPGALFVWFLRERKTEFITIEDEESARTQLRELRDGKTDRAFVGGGGGYRQRAPELSEDQRVALACLRAAPRAGVRERPGETAAFWAEVYRAVRRHLPGGWTEDRWTEACFSLKQQDAQRWQPTRACAEAGDFS